jgi:hypothetical protein
MGRAHPPAVRLEGILPHPRRRPLGRLPDQATLGRQGQQRQRPSRRSRWASLQSTAARSRASRPPPGGGPAPRLAMRVALMASDGVRVGSSPSGTRATITRPRTGSVPQRGSEGEGHAEEDHAGADREAADGPHRPVQVQPQGRGAAGDLAGQPGDGSQPGPGHGGHDHQPAAPGGDVGAGEDQVGRLGRVRGRDLEGVHTPGDRFGLAGQGRVVDLEVIGGQHRRHPEQQREEVESWAANWRGRLGPRACGSRFGPARASRAARLLVGQAAGVHGQLPQHDLGGTRGQPRQ